MYHRIASREFDKFIMASQERVKALANLDAPCCSRDLARQMCHHMYRSIASDDFDTFIKESRARAKELSRGCGYGDAPLSMADREPSRGSGYRDVPLSSVDREPSRGSICRDVALNMADRVVEQAMSSQVPEGGTREYFREVALNMA